MNQGKNGGFPNWNYFSTSGANNEHTLQLLSQSLACVISEFPPLCENNSDIGNVPLAYFRVYVIQTFNYSTTIWIIRYY